MNEERFSALLPEITPANRPFWDGLDAGELRLQRCERCGARRFPESPVCPRCLHDVARWEAASGRGRVWSWIVMHQRYFEALADELPYVVLFVELDEGPRLMARLDGPDESLALDVPVEAVFRRVGDRTVPSFRVAP